MILNHNLAVLITGSWDGAAQSAEIYHPDRKSACIIPDLPDRRAYHTQDSTLVCGGFWTRRSCRRWNPDTGAWDLVTESLTESREGHISWTPADGSVTYLMGGVGSGPDRTTVTLDLDQDNRSRVITAFPLQHRIE